MKRTMSMAGIPEPASLSFPVGGEVCTPTVDMPPSQQIEGVSPEVLQPLETSQSGGVSSSPCSMPLRLDSHCLRQLVGEPIEITEEILGVLPKAYPSNFAGRDFRMGVLIGTKNSNSDCIVYRNPGNLFSVVVKDGKYTIVLFYKGATVVGLNGAKESYQTFSNFASKKGVVPIEVEGSDQKIVLSCSELYFKLGCLLLPSHGKPVSAKYISEVCQMSKPSDIKKSTNKIEGFDREGWDGCSYERMVAAKWHDATNKDCFEALSTIARIATMHGVSLTDVRFVEASEEDKKWGSGASVVEMESYLSVNDLGTTEAFGYITQRGTNLLGKALDEVFNYIRSLEFDFDRFISYQLPLFKLVK